jgi:hypothetical protein
MANLTCARCANCGTTQPVENDVCIDVAACQWRQGQPYRLQTPATMVVNADAWHRLKQIEAAAGSLVMAARMLEYAFDGDKLRLAEHNRNEAITRLLALFETKGVTS